MAAHAATWHTISVSGDAQWRIRVNIGYPAKHSPKAMVIFLPGTDGVAALDVEQALSVESAGRSINGLGEQLIAAGYAVAYFNQRGIVDFKDCLTGESTAARADSFFSRCYKEETRAGVNMRNVRGDTLKVLRRIRQLPGMHGRKVILLSFSEGGFHAAKLIGAGLLKADGIVAIGVPSLSPHDTNIMQATRGFFFQRMRAVVALQPDGRLAKARIGELFPLLDEQGKQELRDLFPGEFIDASAIADAWRVQLDDYAVYSQEWSAARPDRHMSGTMAGRAVGAVVGVQWELDNVAEREDVCTQLAHFVGRVAFLYGEHDTRAGPEELKHCDAVNAVRPRFTIDVIPGAGHGLIDSPLVDRDAVFSAILQRVDQVSRK